MKGQWCECNGAIFCQEDSGCDNCAVPTAINQGMSAGKLWDAIKWSNQGKDGSVVISADRVKDIDEAVSRLNDK